MALTGAILFGFVVVHMLGNLQVFLGPEKFDAYARTLQSMPALVWAARSALLVSVMVHIVAAVQLAALNSRARPRRYIRKRNIASTYASRTMMLSGPALAAFIVYHLLHFTTGQAHPDFRPGSVYHNVIAGFSRVPVSAAYIVAMILLGAHLLHGIWSMFQSIGAHHPRYMPALRNLALAAAAIIVLGNCSIPVAVLTGWIR